MSVSNILAELEAQRDRIEDAIRALQTDGRKRGGSNGKRHMSVEARRKIGEAAKKRWAKVRREKKAAALQVAA